MADFANTVVKALDRVDPKGELSMNEIEDMFGSEGINFIRDSNSYHYYLADAYDQIIVGGSYRPGDDNVVISRPSYEGVDLNGDNPVISEYYEIGIRDYHIRKPKTELTRQETNPRNLARMIMNGVNCIESIMMLTSPTAMFEVVRRLGFIGFTGDRDTVVQLCWWFIVCRESDGGWMAPIVTPNQSYGLNLTSISTLRLLAQNDVYDTDGLDRASCLWMLITGAYSPAPSYIEMNNNSGYRPRAELAIATYLYGLYEPDNITTSPLRLLEMGTASFEHEQMISDLVLGTRSVYDLANQIDMVIPEDEYVPEQYFLENFKDQIA